MTNQIYKKAVKLNIISYFQIKIDSEKQISTEKRKTKFVSSQLKIHNTIVILIRHICKRFQI